MPPLQAPPSRLPFYLLVLVTFHVATIIASNYLVQLPVQLLGFHSTWGAFSFPLIFLATDLTVRFVGERSARRVIGRAMLPALAASYVVGALFRDGSFNGLGALAEFNTIVFRIAVASFAAYVLGQLLDIHVFARVRQRSRRWWLAPVASAVLGQLLDTAAFFCIAFWRSSNPFMAAHWVEIAWVDYAIKLSVSVLFFVPAYGALLAGIGRWLGRQPAAAATAR